MEQAVREYSDWIEEETLSAGKDPVAELLRTRTDEARSPVQAWLMPVVDDIERCIRERLIQTEIPGLHMIPSHINLVGAEIEMLELENRESVLKNALAPIRDNYDFIIIDCSPSLGLITVNTLTAADSVIIPVQPEFFALEGLGKLLQTIRLVQNGVNPALTIEGFVVTMFDGRTRVHTQVVGELRDHFKDMVFKTIIQRNIRLSEAPSHGKPIILYDVMSNGTSNYLNLAKEFLLKNGYTI